MFRYYIGLGANLGNREAALTQALQDIALNGTIYAKSGIYESAAYGVEDQPDFINAVICLNTSLSPLVLLKQLKKIEKSIGRKPRYRWGPREIDLDILDYDGPPVVSKTLTVPHIELDKRLFVLLPLSEIEPKFKNRAGTPIEELLLKCTDRGKVKRLEKSW